MEPPPPSLPLNWRKDSKPYTLVSCAQTLQKGLGFFLGLKDKRVSISLPPLNLAQSRTAQIRKDQRMPGTPEVPG